jgi:myo-inositol-1-phosphate synthase
MLLTWVATYSGLAAPLWPYFGVLVLLPLGRGESGPIGALGLFFKPPDGSTEMNLLKQYDALLRWTAGARDA